MEVKDEHAKDQAKAQNEGSKGSTGKGHCCDWIKICVEHDDNIWVWGGCYTCF